MSAPAIPTAPTPNALEPKALDELRPKLRGPVILPGDAAYDDARSVWNGMIDKRPTAIVRCLGVADVVAAVNFARDRGVLLSIKGGGHNIAGLAVADGALTLDLSLMRGVWVRPDERIAHAQAGCLLGDVDRETQLHGLATVMGFVSNTGIAGLTLGGGFGYLTRRWGWTSDNVRSIDLVTADGKLVRASEHENGDLFWGLRGAGTNFGVATGFEYALHPVGPEIIGGAMAWPIEQAAEVLELYRKTVKEAPPELACVLGLRLAPPAPWIAKEAHGKPIVFISFCDTGALADGERRVAPFKSLGTRVGDIVMRRSYVSQQSLLDATQPKGRRYYWKSEYLPGVEESMLSAALEQVPRIVSGHSAILFFPLDGALGSSSTEHSSVGNRDAGFVFNVAAAWDKPEDDGRNVEWARASWRDLRRFSTGGTYVNFLTEEEGDDRVRAAYGKNYDRLAALKSKWDPTNLFRVNKNVAAG